MYTHFWPRFVRHYVVTFDKKMANMANMANTSDFFKRVKNYSSDGPFGSRLASAIDGVAGSQWIGENENPATNNKQNP